MNLRLCRLEIFYFLRVAYPYVRTFQSVCSYNKVIMVRWIIYYHKGKSMFKLILPLSRMLKDDLASEFLKRKSLSFTKRG